MQYIFVCSGLVVCVNTSFGPWLQVCSGLEDSTDCGSLRPLPRHEHASAAYRNTMFVFGGMSDLSINGSSSSSTNRSHSQRYMNDLWQFTLGGDNEISTWHEICETCSPRPSPRIGHMMAAVSHQDETLSIFVHGGTDSRGENLSDLWELKIHSNGLVVKPWTTKTPSSLTRAGGGMALDDDDDDDYDDDDCVYVYGGRGTNDSVTSSVSMYNVTTDSWSEICPDGENSLCCRLDKCPQPRWDIGPVLPAFGSSFYVYGGNSQDGELGDLWSFDVESRLWSNLCSEESQCGQLAPTPRAAGGVASLEESLFIFGSSSHASNDMWRINVPSDTDRYVVSLSIISVDNILLYQEQSLEVSCSSEAL